MVVAVAILTKLLLQELFTKKKKKKAEIRTHKQSQKGSDKTEQYS